MATISKPLNIEDPEAYYLARQLADKLNKPLTQAVVDALRNELTRIQQTPGGPEGNRGNLGTYPRYADCRSPHR